MSEDDQIRSQEQNRYDHIPPDELRDENDTLSQEQGSNHRIPPQEIPGNDKLLSEGQDELNLTCKHTNSSAVRPACLMKQ